MGRIQNAGRMLSWITFTIPTIYSSISSFLCSSSDYGAWDPAWGLSKVNKSELDFLPNKMFLLHLTNDIYFASVVLKPRHKTKVHVVNPFLPNAPLWPHENIRQLLVFWRFQGDEKGILGKNGLMSTWDWVRLSRTCSMWPKIVSTIMSLKKKIRVLSYTTWVSF